MGYEFHIPEKQSRSAQSRRTIPTHHELQGEISIFVWDEPRLDMSAKSAILRRHVNYCGGYRGIAVPPNLCPDGPSEKI